MDSKKKTSPRCTATLTSGLPCSRKRQQGVYCNHHHKASQNLVLRVMEINGIVHFVGDDNSVYCTESVLAKNPNPPIIGRCLKKNGKHVLDA
jgi:hypothetical protein